MPKGQQVQDPGSTPPWVLLARAGQGLDGGDLGTLSSWRAAGAMVSG